MNGNLLLGDRVVLAAVNVIVDRTSFNSARAYNCFPNGISWVVDGILAEETVYHRTVFRQSSKVGGAIILPKELEASVGFILSKNGENGVSFNGYNKFINVDDGKPFCSAVFKTVVISANLIHHPVFLWGTWPFGTFDNPLFDIGHQNLRKMIGTVVVIEVKMLHPNEPVVIDPFLEIIGLIIEDSAD